MFATMKPLLLCAFGDDWGRQRSVSVGKFWGVFQASFLLGFLLLDQNQVKERDAEWVRKIWQRLKPFCSNKTQRISSKHLSLHHHQVIVHFHLSQQSRNPISLSTYLKRLKLSKHLWKLNSGPDRYLALLFTSWWNLNWPKESWGLLQRRI